MISRALQNVCAWCNSASLIPPKDPNDDDEGNEEDEEENEQEEEPAVIREPDE